MAKGKSTGTSKAQKPQRPAKAGKPASKTDNNDSLRQAVKELGGDDDDLELIAGVDSDDEAAAANKSANVDEVGLSPRDFPNVAQKALKAELGAFMKGLDFGSLAPQAAEKADEESEEESDDEESDDEESDDEDDDDEEDEDEEDEDEDEDEDEEESSEDEAPKKVEPKKVEPKKEPKKEQPKKEEAPAKRADPEPTSGRVSHSTCALN